MTLQMPEADGAVLARREKIVAALRQIVPGEGVIAGEREMRPFETDGLTAYRQLPMVVVLPETVEQVAAVLRYCYDEGIRVVPRGAGTSLSGGALPLGRRRAARHGQVQPHPARSITPTASPWSQPGVTNLGITNAVAQRRLLLRARSVLPDRLHDRRQRRGEFRRRALPEIRPDRQQRARHARWC